MARSSASKPSSSSGGSASSTPARNNYAAPHTPIASVKRPRSSIDKSMLSPGSSKTGIPTTPLDTDSDNTNMVMTPKTPGTGNKDALAIDDSNLPMSPMHPARPLVARKGGGDDAGHHHGALKALPLPALEGIDEGEVHAQDVDREKGEEGSWVGRQVDALFSPVLNYINGEDDAEDGHGHGHQDREHPHNHDQYSDGAVKAKAKSKEASDGDVSMEDAKQQQVPPQVSDTSQTTSQETEEEEEEVGDDVHHQQHEDEVSAEGLVEDDGSSQGSLDDEDEFNPYVFIKSLPNYDLVAPLRPPIALPRKLKEAPPISLVLDLDETLVHCTVEPIDDADLVFPVVFHGVTYQVHVRLRPHLFQFLEKIRGKYEVIVFTASQKVYANELLDLIDPEGKYIQYRMFRESCLAVEGNFLKDLTVLGRDLSKSVLVDNSPHAFGYQVDNGIPIESWFDDPNDTELLKLERFLRTLHSADDVRDVVREKFQTYRLVEEA